MIRRRIAALQGAEQPLAAVDAEPGALGEPELHYGRWHRSPAHRASTVALALQDADGTAGLSCASRHRQCGSNAPNTARDILAIDLGRADLGDADLTRTDLTGAYLRDADLTSASLTDVRWPTGTPVPDGWMIDVGTGRLKRAGRLSEVTAPYPW